MICEVKHFYKRKNTTNTREPPFEECCVATKLEKGVSWETRWVVALMVAEHLGVGGLQEAMERPADLEDVLANCQLTWRRECTTCLRLCSLGEENF